MTACSPWAVARLMLGLVWCLVLAPAVWAQSSSSNQVVQAKNEAELVDAVNSGQRHIVVTQHLDVRAKASSDLVLRGTQSITVRVSAVVIPVAHSRAHCLVQRPPGARSIPAHGHSGDSHSWWLTLRQHC